ncbi:hypothetical protein RQP46_010091 [Phenoliferia psychrophenolica]
MQLQAWSLILMGCLSVVSAFDSHHPDAGATLAKRRSTSVAGPCGRNEAGKDFPHSIKGGKKGCVKCGHSATGVELYLTPEKHCFSKCPSGYVGDHTEEDHQAGQAGQTDLVQLCDSHEFDRNDDGLHSVGVDGHGASFSGHLGSVGAGFEHYDLLGQYLLYRVFEHPTRFSFDSRNRRSVVRQHVGGILVRRKLVRVCIGVCIGIGVVSLPLPWHPPGILRVSRCPEHFCHRSPHFFGWIRHKCVGGRDDACFACVRVELLGVDIEHPGTSSSTTQATLSSQAALSASQSTSTTEATSAVSSTAAAATPTSQISAPISCPNFDLDQTSICSSSPLGPDQIKCYYGEGGCGGPYCVYSLQRQRRGELYLHRCFTSISVTYHHEFSHRSLRFRLLECRCDTLWFPYQRQRRGELYLHRCFTSISVTYHHEFSHRSLRFRLLECRCDTRFANDRVVLLPDRDFTQCCNLDLAVLSLSLSLSVDHK